MLKNVEKLRVLGILILDYFNNIFLKFKSLIQDDFDSKTANLILGIILGYTDEIDEDIRDDFSDSNISHILAVSGMHVGYLILFCKIFFEKTVGKRKSNILCIGVLTYYMFLTGLSPSVVRASLMAILILISKLIYRRSDVWTNISLSLLILVICNPFLIQNAGLVLSYMGTIGIVVCSKNFRSKEQEITKFNLLNILKWVCRKIFELFKVTLFVYVFILPIIALYFNKIPVLSLFISGLIGILVAPVIILFFVLILNKIVGNFQLFYLKFDLLKKICSCFDYVIKLILKILVEKLAHFAELGANLPIGKILVITPNLIKVLLYYFFILGFLFIFKNKNNKNAFGKRLNNLLHLFKYRFNQNKLKILSVVLIFIIIISIIKLSPKDLKIYFIDVNQGDACLIVTPKNKKILIDGGGNEDYDVGKNILLPYLLDRGIKSLDYAIISHFDYDHIGGILYLMENISIKKVIISKQFEESENLQRFYSIVQSKKINVQIVQAGDILNIEKDLYFSILWPTKNMISENAINNNSIVCKLNYKDFSMLFTGDIEEVAEKEIVQMYKKSNALNSKVLKVAHHGSKSSSIQEFLNLVTPNVAVIGVGENNNYGHPNADVLQRINNLRCKNF